jgi:hypothetical protein
MWFSPGTPVSSINKTYLHDITEILLKVALNIINQTTKPIMYRTFWGVLWIRLFRFDEIIHQFSYKKYSILPQNSQIGNFKLIFQIKLCILSYYHIIILSVLRPNKTKNKQTIKKKYLLTIFIIYFSSQPFTMTVKNGPKHDTLFCRKIF